MLGRVGSRGVFKRRKRSIFHVSPPRAKLQAHIAIVFNTHRLHHLGQATHVGIRPKSPPRLRPTEVLLPYEREPRKMVIMSRRVTGVPALQGLFEVVVVVAMSFERVVLAIIFFAAKRPNVVARNHVDFVAQVRVGLAAENF